MSNQPANAPSLDQLLAHSDWIRAIARRRFLDASTADDVVQEAWLRATRAPPKDLKDPRGWLAAVTRNVVRRRYGSETARSAREQ